MYSSACTCQSEPQNAEFLLQGRDAVGATFFADR